MSGTKYPEFAAHGDGAVKDLLLVIVVLRENQKRFPIERRKHAVIPGFRSGRNPRFMERKQVPNGLNGRKAVVFEVEMDHNQRPRILLGLFQCPFNDGPDAFEKMSLQCWVGGTGGGAVSDTCRHLPAGGVAKRCNILLDRDGKSRRERAVDAISPFAVVRIAVMRIQERLAAMDAKQIVRGPEGFRHLHDQERKHQKSLQHGSLPLLMTLLCR